MTPEAAKREVLNHIAAGKPAGPLYNHKAKIGNAVVHVRWRSEGKSGGKVWSYNFGPTTLASDYELWICGSPKTYYLIPISIMRKMYDDPATWVDYGHPQLRVAEVNSISHRCTHGKDRSVSLASCFGARL